MLEESVMLALPTLCYLYESFPSTEWKHVCSTDSIEWRIWRVWRYQFQSHLPYKIYNGETGRLLLHDHVGRSFGALSIQNPVNSFSNVSLQALLLRYSMLGQHVCRPNYRQVLTGTLASHNRLQVTA